jgi:hypothetical protein
MEFGKQKVLVLQQICSLPAVKFIRTYCLLTVVGRRKVKVNRSTYTGHCQAPEVARLVARAVKSFLVMKPRLCLAGQRIYRDIIQIS